jgi:3-dehydroquinate synthase
LGGGATTDLAGFVAATYLRGIRLVNLPTTVLGMADAAVGGKTGINLAQGKNLVGAFHEPVGVLCDLDWLATLPADQVQSGLGEIVKCGFIADPAILQVVEHDPDQVRDVTSAGFLDVLTRAIRVKAEVVSGDLRETGAGSGVGREALNYGHTLGHAIEQLEGYTWAHGCADAVGMTFAAEVARGLGMIDDDLVARHRSVLRALGLPVSYDGAPWERVRAVMSLDKKARGTHLRLVLLERAAGLLRVVRDPDEAVLAAGFQAIGGQV